MRTVFVFSLALLCAARANAQPPDSLWSRAYGGGAVEGCHSILRMPEGGYVFAGRTNTFTAGLYDYWLVRANSNGDTLWTCRYGGTGDEVCFAIRQAADGGFMLGGLASSYGSGGYDYWLVKTDASGDSEWSHTFGGALNDIGRALVETADGGYMFAGETRSFGAGSSDFWMVKTDADGDSLWSRTFGGYNTEECYSMRQTPDGGYILAGITYSYGAGSSDGWLVKTDSAGILLWSRTFGGSDLDGFMSVCQTTDGGYIAGGYTQSFGSGGTDGWLVKTDEDGDSLWTRTFGGTGYESCYAVQQTTDGCYILGGSTRPSYYSNSDFKLVKVDTDGNQVWSRTFGGNGNDEFLTAQQTSDGGYILGGTTTSFGAGSDDMWLLKTGRDCFNPPVSPQVVVISQGIDARLFWPPVTVNTFGCPITPTYYLVYYSPAALGPFYYHGYTTDTTYTHLGVIRHASSMFYQVSTYLGPSRLVRQIPPDTPREDVEMLLAREP